MSGRKKKLALLAAVAVVVPVAFVVLGGKAWFRDDAASTAESFIKAIAAADIDAMQSLILMTGEMKQNMAKDPNLLVKMREGLEKDEMHIIGLETVKAYACEYEKKEILGSEFQSAECKIDVILKNGIIKTNIGNIELMKPPGSPWKVALP